jgi:hypothetical protein
VAPGDRQGGTQSLGAPYGCRAGPPRPPPCADPDGTHSLGGPAAAEVALFKPDGDQNFGEGIEYELTSNHEARHTFKAPGTGFALAQTAVNGEGIDDRY